MIHETSVYKCNNGQKNLIAIFSHDFSASIVLYLDWIVSAALDQSTCQMNKCEQYNLKPSFLLIIGEFKVIYSISLTSWLLRYYVCSGLMNFV